MKIGVIVLNYLAYQATIDTIDSFLKQVCENIETQIIIVDNCSPNDSFKLLSEKYEGHPYVSVIKTNKNLGYASGNNYGYIELQKKMKPDFLVVSNNDILLPQEGLYDWIICCYHKYKFALLGPDIYSLKGNYHQSPMKRRSQNIDECKKARRRIWLSIIKHRLASIFTSKVSNTVHAWDNPYYKEYNDEQTLHGSFQIFSSDYFRVFDLPYDPRTFLYLEEDIVRLRCDKSGLKCVYDPTYQVYHLQSIATNMISDNERKKVIKRRHNCYNSLNVYIKVIEELS